MILLRKKQCALFERLAFYGVSVFLLAAVILLFVARFLYKGVCFLKGEKNENAW